MGAAEGRLITKVIDFRPFSNNLPPLLEPDNDNIDDECFFPDIEDAEECISNWFLTALDQRNDDGPSTNNDNNSNNTPPSP